MLSKLRRKAASVLRGLFKRKAAPAETHDAGEAIRRQLLSFHFDAAESFLRAQRASLPPRLAKSLRLAIRFNKSGELLERLNDVDAMKFVSGPSPQPVGAWVAKWISRKRFMVRGKVDAGVQRVGLFVNDRLVRMINTSEIPGDERGRRQFNFNLKQSTVKTFPRRATVAMGSPEGYLLYSRERLQLRSSRLNGGDGTLFEKLQGDWFINKKGMLALRLDRNQEWKDRALQAYLELKEYFERKFGHKVYFICGSLLGYCREKDFIPHDDDLDVSFLSSATSPEAVKEEVKEMVFQILMDGIDVKLARRPGFFKPRFNGVFIDVTPMWHDKGDMWMLNATHLRAGPEVIKPVREGEFLGRKVYVPNDPERVLELEYGPGWRVPDPGYRTVFDPEENRYLTRSCLSEEEIDQLYERVEKARETNPGMGKLTRAGSRDNAG